MKKKKGFFKKLKSNKLSEIAFVLALIGLTLSVFLGMIGSKYISMKWVMIGAGVTALFWLLLIRMTTRKPTLSIFINLILVFALSASSLVALRLSSFSNEITIKSDIDTVSVVTSLDSGLTTESDFFGTKMAVFADDEVYNSWAISLLQDADKYTGITLKYYDTHLEGYIALLNGEVDLMVMSADAESELVETEDEAVTTKEYIVLYTDTKDVAVEALPSVDVNKNGFTVLINGIDLSGNNINKKARADICILVTINPSTGKINLQVLPRDLWVELPCRDNLKTKLNRSGSQGGVSCTIDAIERYFDYELEINYYAKINFQGFEDLVDALGGIEAYSYYTFCEETYGKEYCYIKGMNKMNGEEALAFARIRKSLPGNDVARGNHQIEIIKGILNKFLKNPSLDTMNKILKAVEGNFVTSFEEKQFVGLLELLLSIKDKMVIESHSMTGGIEWDYDQIYKTDLYYFVPDEGEKEAALQRIKDTLAGK